MKIIYLQDEDRRREITNRRTEGTSGSFGVSSKGKIIEKETKRSKNESKQKQKDAQSASGDFCFRQFTSIHERCLV